MIKPLVHFCCTDKVQGHNDDVKNQNQKYLKGITVMQLDRLTLCLVVSAISITKLKRQTVLFYFGTLPGRLETNHGIKSMNT